MMIVIVILSAVIGILVALFFLRKKKVNPRKIYNIPIPRNQSFLLHVPISRLPKNHSAYQLELLLDHAQELVCTNRLSIEFDKLPDVILSIPSSVVTSHDIQFAILGRVYVLLTFLVSIHINTKDYDNPNANAHIHPKLWNHLKKVAQALGCKPVISYVSELFFNWRPIYNSDSASNALWVNSTMTGSIDEAWFYRIPLLIESKSDKIIPIIIQLYEQCSKPKFEKIHKLLSDLGNAIKEMVVILKKMHSYCSPVVFYHGFRSYQMGWEGLHGASAAQSPILQLLDALLNVNHGSNTSHGKYLCELRPYMLPEHREFIVWVEEWSIKLSSLFSITESSANESYKMAKETFNMCVDNLKTFRKVHMGLVKHFLIQQKTNHDPLVGSGDTDVLPFLQSVYSDTDHSRLN